MEEKIKIYLPENIYSILLKDMELFEFFKKDHSLNKNEFYNTLIMNYYDNYNKNTSDTYEYIKKVLDNLNIDQIDSSDATYQIVNFIQKQSLNLNNKKLDVTISIKPTKQSSSTIDYIQNFLLNGSTLSNWFRNLFTSYTMLPQDKRERIIFKQNFEKIEEALEKNRKIYFVNANNKTIKHIMSPYAISSSKEELFNYLIGEEYDKPYSYRITRIKNITILNEECSFDDNLITLFNKMIQRGPQFAYSIDQKEDIIVRINERGKMMYDKIYLHRPIYTKIENDLYYFDCSYAQAYQYFIRLGKNAVVISPKSLRDDIESYYQTSRKAYMKERNIQ